MNWYYNLSIKTKLLCGFLTVLTLTVLLGLFAIRELSIVNQHSASQTSYILNVLSNSADIRIASLKMMAGPEYKINNVTNANIPTSQEDIEKLLAETREHLNTILPVLKKEENRQHVRDMLAKVDEYQKLNQEVFSLIAAGNVEQAHSIVSHKSIVLANDINATSRALQDNVTKISEDAFASSLAENNKIRMAIIIALVVCVLIGIGLATFISIVVSKPILQAISLAKRVAGGDLSVRFPSPYKDETGQLITTLDEMSQSLSTIVSHIRQGSESIYVASNQIAAGNMDLSSRTEQQASSLEETASAMEELTSTVKQNADNAAQANKLAINASEVATSGGEVMDNVVKTMGTINESSHKIVDIISVIDSIAFQTNILALNAAVEAARAGEQGRGFAVVASEVRNLAQRSASAAKEIKSLIDHSVDNVNYGNELVAQAGKTMTDVVTSIRRVTDIVSEITAASKEQSSGLEQINIAITQMDEVTQQNAALVEEAASATQSMVNQAGTLQKDVAFFRITGNTTKLPTAPSRSSAAPAATKNITTAPVTSQPQKAPAIAASRGTEKKKPVTTAPDNDDDWTEF